MTTKWGDYMWYAPIYSKGDLLNDEYLQVNRHTEKDVETGEYFETFQDRFEFSEDIQERIDFITSCIERLQEEREFLKRYGDKLVRLGSYDNLED